MDSWVSSPWNPACQVSFDRWLVTHVSEAEKERLRILGNIVVPSQAAAGISMLVQVARLVAGP